MKVYIYVYICATRVWTCANTTQKQKKMSGTYTYVYANKCSTDVSTNVLHTLPYTLHSHSLIRKCM